MATKNILLDFIQKSLIDRNAPYKWIKIGDIITDAQERIEQKCGVIVSEIHIDNYSIIHAMTQAHHNLDPGDLLHAVDVINTSTEIDISYKQHLSNDVLLFKKNIDGEITFLTEIHVKRAYLLVFNAWRQKKARRYPDAADRPPRVYVQDDSPSASQNISRKG